MTADEARRDTDLRARVRVASGASDRLIVDLLNGFEADSTAAHRARRALADAGVDMATVPTRSADEVRVWKRGRQPRLTNAMPSGYVVETCPDCGEEYPRRKAETVSRCPRCWWRHADKLERALADATAENAGMRQRLADTPVPLLRTA